MHIDINRITLCVAGFTIWCLFLYIFISHPILILWLSFWYCITSNLYHTLCCILWNSMTMTSFGFTELANTMKYGRGVLYTLVFTEWRHCVSQNKVWERVSYIPFFSPSHVTAFHVVKWGTKLRNVFETLCPYHEQMGLVKNSHFLRCRVLYIFNAKVTWKHWICIFIYCPSLSLSIIVHDLYTCICHFP